MTKIGDVAQVYDGPHATPKKIEHGPYFLSISSLVGGSLDLSKSAHLSQKDFEKWTKRVTPREGDVLFSYETRLGEAALMPPKIKACLGRRMGLLRPDVTKVIPEYLLYAYLSPGFQQVLKEKTIHGATVERISLRELPDFPVWIPPLAEQKKVVEVLQSLYSKIHLNTQINQTLEQMAQALFKSWFVDFDPVIDNALDAGNPIPEPLAERAARRQTMWAAGSGKAPARLPAETRRLFPDRFEEDEVLGWVPKGWKAARLSDITTELRRGISPKYVEEGGVQVINQKCIRNHEVNFSLCRRNDSGVKKVDGRLLELGDLLVNSTGTGTLGRVAMIEQLPEPTVVDSHVTIIRTDPSVYPKHVFAQQMIFIEPYVTALGEGSTGQTELSRKMVSDIQIVMPTFDCLEQLEVKISAFSQFRSQNRNQVEVLTQLRDTLLPKLLSGELQLPEAEAAVDTALETEFA